MPTSIRTLNWPKFFEKTGGSNNEVADAYQVIGKVYDAAGGRKNKREASQWFDIAKRVANDPEFWGSLGNTFFYMLTIPVNLLLALGRFALGGELAGDVADQDQPFAALRSRQRVADCLVRRCHHGELGVRVAVPPSCQMGRK